MLAKTLKTIHPLGCLVSACDKTAKKQMCQQSYLLPSQIFNLKKRLLRQGEHLQKGKKKRKIRAFGKTYQAILGK